MEEMFAKSCDKTTMQMKTLKEYKSGICFRYRHKNPSSKWWQIDFSNIYKILDSSNMYLSQEDRVDIIDKYQCIFQGNNITIKITCSSQYVQKTPKP